MTEAGGDRRWVNFICTGGDSHYRKDGLCRAPKDLLGAFHRAHGKGHSLPCAHATPHSSDKRTVQISLPCVDPKAHGKEQPVSCVVLTPKFGKVRSLTCGSNSVRNPSGGRKVSSDEFSRRVRGRQFASVR
jgi:hypothetical protein